MSDAQPDPTQQFNALREKRKALERAFRVAQGVERLFRGLETALLLEHQPRHLAVRVQSFLDHLDPATLGLPTSELEASLRELDQAVQADLARMMDLARSEERLAEQLEDEHAEAARGLLRTLEAFRRKAHTAVALRLVLRERGIATPALDLRMPTVEIRRQIVLLKMREQDCRERIEQQIADIQLSIDQLLARDDINPAMVELLDEVSAGLTRNLQHLRRGGSTEDLPVSLAVIELATPPPVCAPEPTPEPRPRPPLRKPPPPKMGFWRRLWLWLTTPTSIRWRDIGNHREDDHTPPD